MYQVSEEERKRRIEEQIGKTYGYLTILSFAEYRNHDMFFNCRCVCGTENVDNSSKWYKFFHFKIGQLSKVNALSQ